MNGSMRGEEKLIDYTVALEANEVHCHWDGAVTVPVQGLDVVQQVCEELVTPFEHTEGHDVVPSHFLHDLSGQSLCPGVTWEVERERERETDRDRQREREKERTVSSVFCYSQQ